MRRIIWLVLLLMLAQNCWAVGINRFLSGSWFNALQNGHGLSIEVISDEQTVIYWYVYHPDGTPTFLIAVGTNNNNIVQADVFYNSGMKFGDFDPDDITEIPWGTIELTFHSCNSATLEYSSELEYDGVPYGSGSIPLTKLLTIDEMQCSDQPQAGIYQGNFVSSISEEIMPGMAIISPDGEFAAISYANMAAIGDWSLKGNTLTGTGTAVSADPDEEFDSKFTVTSQISPEYRMVGSYSISGGDRGSLDLYAVPSLYRRAVSLSAISGDYDLGNQVTGATGSALLSANGDLSGSDSSGCKYNGQLSQPDTNFNLFKVTITVSSCGNANGMYTGYGVQIDYFSLGDSRILRIVTTNDSFAAVIDLYN